ncbi:nucleotidyltransferase family protein [Pseudomonas veronii]|nr:nucleotidyltransferase family protein [Pseudomonas veronii]KAA6181067.1 nucleotidyltransferase family protein [Pseudomonas veronii]
MAAPLRMEDLFNLTLRLTHRFIQDKQAIFRERIASKGWL